MMPHRTLLNQKTIAARREAFQALEATREVVRQVDLAYAKAG